jgi:hypothetical protein
VCGLSKRLSDEFAAHYAENYRVGFRLICQLLNCCNSPVEQAARRSPEPRAA